MNQARDDFTDAERLEHDFARDFVFCVAKEWRPDWSAGGIFRETSENSPFSSSMRNKVLEELFEERHKFQEIFESEFPGADITDESFQIVADDLMDDYITPTRRNHFDPERFYNFCLKLSKFAAHVLCFNVESAPHIAVNNIFETIKELKSQKSFDESSFTKLDRYCAGLPFE